MSKQPLAEVFGFPVDNMSTQANRHRKNKLCPYNNKVPNCTKDKANDPLGVCSIHYGKDVVITCPVRFRQEWIIAEDAAQFFFSENTAWTSLTEVRLKDMHGQSAGNIDVVLVAYDNQGRVIDFGALEVQTVHISGHVRRHFDHYTEKITGNRIGFLYPDLDIDLKTTIYSLVQFLLNAGIIFNSWGKKIAIAIDKSVYSAFPPLPEVGINDGELGLMLYDLQHNGELFNLQMERTVYIQIQPALRVFKHEIDFEFETPSIYENNLSSEKAFKSFIEKELNRITVSERPLWDLSW